MNDHSPKPRLTLATMEVLKVFLENPRHEFSGIDITNEVGTKSGTLYPILIRLEEAGWLASRWEDVEPNSVGRPKRRYYRITGEGQRSACAALKKVHPNPGGLAWEY